MGFSSIMALLFSVEAAVTIPHAAAAPLPRAPPPPPRGAFIYIRPPSPQRGIKSVQLRSVFMQLNSPAVVPTSAAEFVSAGGKLSGLRTLPES